MKLVYHKTILKGSLFFFIGSLVSKLFSYIYNVFIARYFGPETYGIFVLSLTVLSFGGMFSKLGVHSALIRFISYYSAKGDDTKVKGSILSAFYIVLCASLVVSVIIYSMSDIISAHLFKRNVGFILKILSMTIPFTSIFFVISFSFIGFKKMEYHVMFSYVGQNLIRVIIIVIFGLIFGDILGLTIAYAISEITIALIAFYFFYRIIMSRFSEIISVRVTGELMSFSLPLLVSSFLGFFLSYTDRLMLGYFMSPVEVALYDAGLRLAMITTMFTAGIVSLFYPVITEIFAKKDIKMLKILFIDVNKWSLYISLPIASSLILFPGFALILSFGNEYIDARTVLQILSIKFLIDIFLTTSFNMITSIGRVAYVAIINVIAIILNVSMNYFLIPVYGIEGAAISTLTVTAFGVVLSSGVIYRYVRVHQYGIYILKGSISAFIPLLILKFIKPSSFFLFISPVMLLISYVLLLLIFRGFDSTDIEIIKLIERKLNMKFGILRNIMKRFI